MLLLGTLIFLLVFVVSAPPWASPSFCLIPTAETEIWASI